MDNFSVKSFAIGVANL